MSPRPAPDLDLRRDQVIRAARDLAEADGWPAVTMRRLAGELGVTQPVLYSAFAGRSDDLLGEPTSEHERLKLQCAVQDPQQAQHHLHLPT
jgi:AcrR family transcriptional regulator